MAVALCGAMAAAESAAAHSPSLLYPVRWPAYDTSPFNINVFFAKGFPARKFRNRIRSASKQWNRLQRGPVLKTRFDAAKKATAQSACDDVPERQGLMQYGSVSGSAIAVTARCIHKMDGYPRTLKSFLVTFDSEESKAWNKSTGSAKRGKKADVQAVATHELGHALGSDDYITRSGNAHCLDDTRRETMCKIYYRGHERERTLGAHDKETFREAYPSPVWWGDAERARKHEWASAANQACAASDSTKPVTTNVVQGSRSYNIYVKDGPGWDVEPDGTTSDLSTRCEIANDNPGDPGFPLYHENDDLWFSWQVYLDPNDFKASWPGGADPCVASSPKDFQAIAQWKQKGGRGAPALAMGVLSGRYCLNLSPDQYGDNQPGRRFNLGAATRGVWARFTLREHIGPETSGSRAGAIHLCGDLRDGLGWRELVPITPTWTTKYATDTSSVSLPVHSRIGIYRGKNLTGTEHIGYDGYTIATSRTVAENNAFGAPVAGSPCSEGGGRYQLPF